MKLKRLFCVLFATLTMMFSVYASAAPVEAEPVDPSVQSDDVTRAEETTWLYRVYEGRIQKRLWSNTRGIWLTDWIDC